MFVGYRICTVFTDDDAGIRDILSGGKSVGLRDIKSSKDFPKATGKGDMYNKAADML